MNNHAVRRRRNKDEEKSYLFTARKDLWTEVESITQDLDVSIAHFIRESIKRNIKQYQKTQTL